MSEKHIQGIFDGEKTVEQEIIKEKYKFWSGNSYFDLQTREELLSISNTKEIEERFFQDLEFGTAGMRGILGAGTNRINKYIVRKITQALADTIKDYGQEACKRGVVIGYDSRRYSDEFARETALVLAANGIKAYLFDSLRPTPEVSFAVRCLKTMAGVMITASHNPKEYNGYKLYWEDGGQIPPDKVSHIIDKQNRRDSWFVEIMDENEAVAQGLLQIIGEEVDRAYLAEVKNQLLHPALVRGAGSKLKIVYTPLHGTGNIPVNRCLSEAGFTNVFVVPEQEKPDSEFSTIKVPNPEDPKAFELALHYAREKKADIVLASDPDADRLGLYFRNDNGDYIRYNGNQIGVVLEYYILSRKKKMQKLPDNAVVVKTVASTDLGDAVAKLFGVKTVNVLVGFKYIAEQIKEMEEKEWGTFQWGFEESFGYLAGTYTRDKDAILAAALLAEAALYYKEKEDKTLADVLEEIHQTCGYYIDMQKAFTFEGREGMNRIIKIMDRLRTQETKVIGGQVVKSIEDFQIGVSKNMADSHKSMMNLPKSNVLKFSFEGGGFVMARPSGTEPKIRFYFCIKGDSENKGNEILQKVIVDFLKPLDDLITK